MTLTPQYSKALWRYSYTLAVAWILVFLSVSVSNGQGVQKLQLAIGEASVLEVRGTVTRAVMGMTPTGSPDSLSTGMRLAAGDRIRSAANGFALLGLADGSTIEIQPDTELELLDFSGGVRELFRIWLGKVRLKIRKLVGAPNPYEMRTPIATIGVRGTEFEIQVDQDSVTTVRVFEGLVAVKNTQVNADEVLVAEGQQVTLYPMRPPNPPVSFEQVVAENFNRETVEEYPLLQKFLAFPDTHLDILDNPAYASRVVKPTGRFYFYPARSSSFLRPEISPLNPLNQFTDIDELFATDERRLQGISTRVSYAQPVGDWVLAGLYEYRDFSQDFRFRISRRIPSAFGGEVSLEQIGNSLFAPELTLNSGTHRSMFLAARRFPGQALAFSYDWSHSGGDVSSLYEFRPGGFLLTQDAVETGFRSDNRRISIGYHRENDSIGSLALVFRTGFISGRSVQTFHEYNGEPAALANFDTAGTTMESGLKWRRRLARNIFLALSGSLTRAQIDRGIRNFRVADSTEETVFWIPSVAGGLGFKWRDRLFGALDYQYSGFRQTAHRMQLIDGLPVGRERGIRHDNALHGWLQVQLPWSFFSGGGFTSYWSNEAVSGFYQYDDTGKRLDARGQPVESMEFEQGSYHLDQIGFSIGRRFKDTLFLEYQLTKTLGPAFRPLSHSFLLRLGF